jgi:hypothetical protein
MNASVDWQALQEFVASVATHIERIPAAVWVGIVGAGVVAWWANRGQTQRLQLQLQAERERLTEKLDHDSARRGFEFSEAASARALERTVSMRREIYFAAASELARADLRLVRVPLQDALPSGLTNELVLELGRVELVGEGECRRLAAMAIAAYTHADLAAAKAYLPVSAAEQELGKAEFDVRGATQELEALHTQMRRVRDESDSGIVNPQGLSDLPRLSKRADELKSLMDSAHDRRLTAIVGLDQARDAALHEIGVALQESRRVGAQLAAAMRRELGFVDREEDLLNTL